MDRPICNVWIEKSISPLGRSVKSTFMVNYCHVLSGKLLCCSFYLFYLANEIFSPWIESKFSSCVYVCVLHAWSINAQASGCISFNGFRTWNQNDFISDIRCTQLIYLNCTLPETRGTSLSKSSQFSSLAFYMTAGGSGSLFPPPPGGCEGFWSPWFLSEDGLKR